MEQLEKATLGGEVDSDDDRSSSRCSSTRPSSRSTRARSSPRSPIPGSTRRCAVRARPDRDADARPLLRHDRAGDGDGRDQRHHADRPVLRSWSRSSRTRTRRRSARSCGTRSFPGADVRRARRQPAPHRVPVRRRERQAAVHAVQPGGRAAAGDAHRDAAASTRRSTSSSAAQPAARPTAPRATCVQAGDTLSAIAGRYYQRARASGGAIAMRERGSTTRAASSRDALLASRRST